MKEKLKDCNLMMDEHVDIECVMEAFTIYTKSNNKISGIHLSQQNANHLSDRQLYIKETTYSSRNTYLTAFTTHK